ncbi:MAG: hypothetical protein JJE55_07010 [Flavobacteriaceae bacterium]|nr:hypothetical protein [Flavobacteriaceae bacterium]
MAALETTYTVIGSTFTGTMIFKYDLDGFLTHFELVDAQLDEKQRNWLYTQKFPYTVERLKHFYAISNFTVTKGMPDLSFEAFYNLFGNKVKRTRSESLWNKLTDTEKTNAIASVKPYKYWLGRQRGIAQQQPDTYISQKRWLDDFRSM